MLDLTLLAAEETEIHAGYEGFWADTAGIMLVLPLIAFLLILAFGKRMRYDGAEFAIGALAIGSLWGTVLLILNATQGVLTETTFEIAPARIVTLWYGALAPVAPNDTEEGRSQNRRVAGIIGGISE